MPNVVSITSKGQVTIPKAIRDIFSLTKKDKLIFTSLRNSVIVIKPLKKSFLDFGGSVKAKRKPENFSLIRKKVLKGMAQSTMNRG